MDALATILQPDYFGIESVRDKVEITISYWDSLDAIRSWKNQGDYSLTEEKKKSTIVCSIFRIEEDCGFEK